MTSETILIIVIAVLLGQFIFEEILGNLNQKHFIVVSLPNGHVSLFAAGEV